MAEKFIQGEYVGSGEPFAAQIWEFQRRYAQLLGELAREGTEVERTLINEVDLDIAPHRFIRNARHVFVFPPQETELKDKEGEEVGVIPGTEPYTLTRVARSADFDPEKVVATAVVSYDDADSRPVLRLSDTTENGSENMLNLPGAVQSTIEAVFTPVAKATS